MIESQQEIKSKMCTWNYGCVVILHSIREELRIMGDEKKRQRTITSMMTWKWWQDDWSNKRWSEEMKAAQS